MAGGEDALEGGERVAAGYARWWHANPVGVDPEGGGAGDDADAVIGPDRVPVL